MRHLAFLDTYHQRIIRSDLEGFTVIACLEHILAEGCCKYAE